MTAEPMDAYERDGDSDEIMQGDPFCCCCCAGTCNDDPYPDEP